MAEVRVIREGWWRWIERGVRFDVTCTATLIESRGKRILVDAPNAGEEKAFLEALAAAGAAPESIDFVVVTHFHPDHLGCLTIFPRAEFIGPGTRWRGSIHAYWPEDRLDLTDEAYVLKTPGHTPHDVSVFAETSEGTVGCVGDLWVRSVSDPRLAIVHDPAKLAESRRRVASLADRLVPGHGPMEPSSEARF
jgi:glyoxylase-like metal-dependent hydrolase (beta-lactamase superfamily II)